MNIQQLCDYLNEIGIIDIDNIKHFLEITTYMLNNNLQNESNKSINDIYKIALFSYIREINEDDKNLFFTCSNIINSFKRFIILKKYNSLFLFKKLVYLKIYQRYKSFLISLYKKFPFKSYHTNKYHQSKKRKSTSKSPNINIYKNPKEINPNFNNDQNINLNLNNNNHIITFKPQENEIPIMENYKYIKELIPVKKTNKINNTICINQSNINFAKYFINKKFILCKKNHSYLSYIDRVKSNKKELYSQNPYEYSYSSFTLRKNKSEKKLRIMKLNYEDKTRSKNFESLQPKIKRAIRARKKSKKDKELSEKEDVDKKYNELKKKDIDKNNWVDRLYRNEVIKQLEEEKKQKEEINKNKKSPIDWEKLYLNTNEKIIKNNKEIKMNKSCSYFMPRKGRIYKYTSTIESENNNMNNFNTINTNNNNKENKTIETSINRDKEKSVKISLDLNSPNKNPNLISNNTFEIKESELNSLNSEKEENKSIEKNEEKKEINNELKNSKNSNFSDDNINFDKIKEKLEINTSPQGLKSKGIQELLSRKNFDNKLGINNEEKKEENKDNKDRGDFNDLLSNNNGFDNII